MEKEIHFSSRGRSGNIYYILGMVSQEFRKQRRYTDFNNLRDQVFEAESYEEALKIIGKQIPLHDDSTGKEYN